MLSQINKPKFEIVRTASGEISIRNNIVNEIMHNPVGPWAEANLLYIDSSGLHKLLSQDQDNRTPPNPLVIYDVGLGAAANALAAISCASSVASNHGSHRPMTIVSFENDLSLLSFVIDNAEHIPYVSIHADKLKLLLENRYWTDENDLIEWYLHEGNFLDKVADAPQNPEVVFYDPYSPGVNHEMWTVDAFSRLFEKTEQGTLPCSLYTYSRATSIRTAMLAAGFFVGSGSRSGLKTETTQTATHVSLLKAPLDQRWLIRWLRSHTRFPPACRPEDQNLVTNQVLTHQQFSDYIVNALLGWRKLTMLV